MAVPVEWGALFGRGGHGVVSVETTPVAVMRQGKWGFIDQEGRLVLPLEWDNASPFDASGLACVSKGGKWGYIDRCGRVVLPIEWDDAWAFDSSDLAVVSKADKWGFIDRSGKLAIASEWDDAEPFDEKGMALVKKGDKFGFIGREGQVVVPVEWDYADRAFCFDLALVSDGVKSGFVDRTGKMAIPLESGRIQPFEEPGLARIYDGFPNEKVEFIDRTGRIVVAPRHKDGAIQTDGVTGVHRISVWSSAPEVDLQEFLRQQLAILEFVGWKLPPRAVLFEQYDTDGRLVWSSDWLSERTWLVIAAIGIGILEIGCLCSRKGPAA